MYSKRWYTANVTVPKTLNGVSAEHKTHEMTDPEVGYAEIRLDLHCCLHVDGSASDFPLIHSGKRHLTVWLYVFLC